MKYKLTFTFFCDFISYFASCSTLIVLGLNWVRCGWMDGMKATCFIWLVFIHRTTLTQSSRIRTRYTIPLFIQQLYSSAQLDDNFKIDAHVQSDIGNLICLRHLFRSRAVAFLYTSGREIKRTYICTLQYQIILISTGNDDVLDHTENNTEPVQHGESEAGDTGLRGRGRETDRQIVHNIYYLSLYYIMYATVTNNTDSQ